MLSFLSFFLLIFRLAEEHSMENHAYNKNHRFSDQFYNAHASQSEEYSEINANFVSFYALKQLHNIIGVIFLATASSVLFV